MALFVSTVAVAQSNDPTYSVRNYKQPNKALEATNNNYEALQEFTNKTVSVESSRNYKAQNTFKNAESVVVLRSINNDEVKNSVFSKRNYKRQF